MSLKIIEIIFFVYLKITLQGCTFCDIFAKKSRISPVSFFDSNIVRNTVFFWSGMIPLLMSPESNMNVQTKELFIIISIPKLHGNNSLFQN